MAFAFYTPVVVTGSVPASQSNFALIVELTLPQFKSVANGGHAQTPYDIRPFADYTLATPLSYQLKKYNASTGFVRMWIKAPTLSAGLTFYMGCGDATLTSDGSAPASVFSNNFLTVLPLEDGTTLDVTSATGTNNGTNHGATAAAGKVGDGAASFNGSNQYIDLGSGINPTAISMSAWIKPSGLGGGYVGIIARNNSGYSVYCMLELKSTGKLYWGVMATSAVAADGTGVTTLAVNNWYHVALTYDSTNGLKGYVNGVLDVSVAANGALNTTAVQTCVGTDINTAGRYFPGLIDQAAIASVARAQSWWQCEYANQNSPSTYVTAGSEMPAGTAPFQVTAMIPACGTSVRDTVDFTATFSDPLQAASLQASDFTVNGTPANSVTNTSTTATFHFNATPITLSTNTMAIAGGAILRNSDGAALQPFACTLGFLAYTPSLQIIPTRSVNGSTLSKPYSALVSGRIAVLDWLVVPCLTGTGVAVNKINAAVRGVRRVPQPFADNLIELFLGSDVQFPDAKLGLPYNVQWSFISSSAAVMTLFSGSLPPGLTWTQLNPQVWLVTGRATVGGAYTFQLKVIVGATSGYITIHINSTPVPIGGFI